MSKSKTTYYAAPADTATTWTLGSSTVRLNSSTAYMNGYFTSTVPSQLNRKNKTTYTDL